MSDSCWYNRKKIYFSLTLVFIIFTILTGNKVHAKDEGLHGLIFYDENNNGKYDENEKGIPGIYIKLLDKSGERIRNKDTNEAISVTTDKDGKFDFSEYSGEIISVKKPANIKKLIYDNFRDEKGYLNITLTKENRYYRIAAGGNSEEIKSLNEKAEDTDNEKWYPVITTLKTAIVGILFTFILGMLLVRVALNIKSKTLRIIFDVFMTLPLVLPPTVIGYMLLKVFGLNSPIGKMFLELFDFKIVFSWESTVIAAVLLSLPLMYRSTLGAIEQVDSNLVYAARTLGFKEGKIFWNILLPNAFTGVAAATILAFARGMGEYGATSMIAGNILGKTRTLPIAVAVSTAAGEDNKAKFYVTVILIMAFILISLMNIITYKISSRRK